MPEIKWTIEERVANYLESIEVQLENLCSLLEAIEMTLRMRNA